ncbi:MAG TPA: aldo/keto reductase [Candidatus Binataceae bacterium]
MNMERRAFGKTGLNVSALGFGGSEIGYQGVPLRVVERILGGALDAGLNVIDTAECYGAGEELIGKAISKRRDEFVLLTKCGHAGSLLGRDWTPKTLERSIDRSLKRLRIDHVDLMQFHSPPPEALHDAVLLEVLTRARDAGKTRFIGCSSDGVTALAAVEMKIFDTLEISVSIADQEAIDLVIPAARKQGMGIIAKRPIANAAWLNDGMSRSDYGWPYRQRLQHLDYDFMHSDPDEAVGVALRFTLSVPGVATAIVGTTRPERWHQNAAHVARGPLPRDQYEAVRARWRAVARPDWTGER